MNELLSIGSSCVVSCSESYHTTRYIVYMYTYSCMYIIEQAAAKQNWLDYSYSGHDELLGK